MSVAFVFNILLIILLVGFVVVFLYFKVKKSVTSEENPSETEIERDKEKYSIRTMQEYIKKQFDEITRMNLYDLALSEEEFERRKNVKYEEYFIFPKI